MATITIRNLSSDIVDRLKIRASTYGRSMEQEARDILTFRLASRDAVLDEVQALWSRMEPPSAADVQDWVQSARRGER